mgnify:CR=1 FL=1
MTQLFTEEQIGKVLEEHRGEDKAVTDLVIDLGFAKDDVFLRALAGSIAALVAQCTGEPSPQTGRTIEVYADGTAEIRSSSADLGQGL